jgi:hypothetical protein
VLFNQCKRPKKGKNLKPASEFETVIENLNKIYAPIVPNLSPFDVHLSTRFSSGILTVELRRKWDIDTKDPAAKHKVFLKKMFTIIFSEQPIIGEVHIKMLDPFRQKCKLKQAGLL